MLYAFTNMQNYKYAELCRNAYYDMFSHSDYTIAAKGHLYKHVVDL